VLLWGVLPVAVTTFFFIAWSASQSLLSNVERPKEIPTVPISPRGAERQAMFVAVEWGPGLAACLTVDPQIVIGDCKRQEDLEWLRRELSMLRQKGVGCLPDLPASFTLRSGDNEKTGAKNFYLFIFDSDGVKRGNLWFRGGKMLVTDLITKKTLWLAYADDETWSAGPDTGHLVRVP
jgi:hypothetical protein